MTNIKKLLQILIPGIILAIIVYALFLFFGGTILYLLGLKYNNLLSLAKFFGIFLILSMILDFIVVCFLKVLKELRGLTDTQYNLLYLTLDIPLNMIIIGISETLIKGVSCSIFYNILFIWYIFREEIKIIRLRQNVLSKPYFKQLFYCCSLSLFVVL